MKILILNYEYPPLGGGAGVIAQKHAELFSEGNKVTVVTSSFSGAHEEEIVNEQLTVIRLKVKRKEKFRSTFAEKIDWMIQTFRYFRKMKQLDYDVCMAHFSIPGGVVAYALKRRFGLKYTIISHGHDIPWFLKHQMFWLHVFLYPFIYFVTVRAEKLFVQSEEMNQNALRFLRRHPQKVVKIPNGSDSSLFFPVQHDGKQDVLNIIFVGRLAAQKQPWLIPPVAKILKDKGVKLKINVLGDGVLRGELEKLIQQHGVQEEVALLGWRSNEEVRAIYQNSQVMLAPTQGEGMSIAILEGLFSGLFVVTNPVSGNPDMIAHLKNGYMSPNSTPEEFAEGVLYYLQNAERIEHDKPANNAWLKERFDWRSITAKYEKVLREIVG